MKKFYLLLIAFLLIGLGGCVSKKYAKQGLKFEQAGMYQMAAEAYYKSIMANRSNVEAAIGLKKNGQRVLDDFILGVHSAYSSGNDKETVYKYLVAKQYQNVIKATGVAIDIPERTEEFYNEARPRYLSKRNDEARLLLEEEKFKAAEEIFAEIKSIDSNFQGVEENMKVSICEPLYREGTEFLNNAMYRKAYENFNSILTNHGIYKDSKDLREEALLKGTTTIAISPFENRTRKQNLNTIMEGKIASALSSLNNPFIKVVDIKNTQTFVNEQYRGTQLGSDIQVGRMLAAKALLTGIIIQYEGTEGRVAREEKRGYLKEIVTQKDPKTGEEVKKTQYKKVNYTEVHGSNAVSINIQFQLSSSETGAVLSTGTFSHKTNDEVHYVLFQGDKSKLVPGHWENAGKDSPKDRVNDTPSEVKKLQDLLGAKQNLKSLASLETEATDAVAKRVAEHINKYNPEK